MITACSIVLKLKEHVIIEVEPEVPNTVDQEENDFTNLIPNLITQLFGQHYVCLYNLYLNISK